MGRGALVFKGEAAPKKKKKSSKHHSKKKLAAGTISEVAKPSSLVEGNKHEPTAAVTTAAAPQIKTGTGKITSSGTVVTGQDTCFGKEIHAGDAILVQHSAGRQQEMRVVTMRLSDISLNLSSAFTQNLSTPVSFQYINKPSSAARAAAGDKADDGSHQIAQDDAFGMYYGGSTNKNELVYREKTEHGSYRIKRVKVAGGGGEDLSRQDLLEMRTKKKSDKYC